MRTISREEVAEHLGISPQAVSRLAKKPGCPKEVQAGRAVYPWPDFNVWYWTVVKAPKPADFSEARARRVAALADMAELQLAKLRGELMPVEDFRRVRYDTDQRVAVKLKALHTRAAPHLVGCQSELEAMARLAPVVREIMDELTKGDVPTEDAEAA